MELKLSEASQPQARRTWRAFVARVEDWDRVHGWCKTAHLIVAAMERALRANSIDMLLAAFDMDFFNSVLSRARLAQDLWPAEAHQHPSMAAAQARLQAEASAKPAPAALPQPPSRPRPAVPPAPPALPVPQVWPGVPGEARL